jgi:hypothetical protein
MLHFKSICICGRHPPVLPALRHDGAFDPFNLKKTQLRAAPSFGRLSEAARRYPLTVRH